MRSRIIMVVLIPVLLSAQTAQNTDIWKNFRFFIGKWEGQGEGKSGISKGYQEFQFILNDKFLSIKNKAVFEPQKNNPKGEVHEDLGFISYDQMRQKFVLRQFHIEGFVNQYVLDTVSDDGRTFIFESETIENIPAGFKARLTYKILNDNEFQQSFDLASPGEEYQCYSTGKMIRKNKTAP